MFENMTKAYDFKALYEEMKKEMPELTEEAAKAIIKKVFPWLQKSAQLSETKIDDVVAMGYPILEEKLEELAEEINPADNA